MGLIAPNLGLFTKKINNEQGKKMSEQQFDFVENDFVGHDSLEPVNYATEVEKIDLIAAFVVEVADWITEIHPNGRDLDPVINKFLKDIEKSS